MQDEITEQIVTALQVRLTEGEQARLRRRQTHDLAAWECFARSREHLRRFNKEDNLVARGLLEKALNHDPEFPAAWSHPAWTHLVDARLGLIEKAMRYSPFYPDWYLGIKGVILRVLGRFDEAIEVDRERLARNPDQTLSNFRLAAVYSEIGDEEKAKDQIAQLLTKNPHASIRQVRVSEPYRDESELERYLDLLRRAGLPE